MNNFSKYVFFATICGLILMPTYAHSADIYIKENSCRVTVNGDFNNKTHSHFEAALKKIQQLDTCKNRLFQVFLNSPGGDVSAAIAVGRLIRNARVSTAVMSADSCSSACVLAFLGGVKREVFGKIGLHRAFSVEPPENNNDVRKSRHHIDGIIKQYLQDMNIPSRLLEEMNSVSPGDMRWIIGGELYDGEKLNHLKITGTDHVWEDENDAKAARNLGITLSEFYKRRQMMKQYCREPERIDYQGIEYKLYVKCRRDIMYDNLD